MFVNNLGQPGKGITFYQVSLRVNRVGRRNNYYECSSPFRGPLVTRKGVDENGDRRAQNGGRVTIKSSEYDLYKDNKVRGLRPHNAQR